MMMWVESLQYYKDEFDTPSRFRQVLLALAHGGVILLVPLNLLLALLAPSDVLNRHPALAAYVAGMAHYFPSIDIFMTGARYPEVSGLVFAVAWGVALIPFLAFWVEGLVYWLVLDTSRSRARMAQRYG